MALPLKSGADLYNQQALRLRLHNLGADPLEVGDGLIYYNTSTGLNTSGKARIYTGAGWKTLAFSEDLDVASNADFLALKEKVELLSGDVDTDAIISNMKEVSAFLDGFAEDADLMDYLTTELGKKLDKTGGTITSEESTPLALKSTSSSGHTLIQFWSGENYLGALGFKGRDDPYFITANGGLNALIHSGNVGDYKAGDSDKLGGQPASSYVDKKTITEDLNAEDLYGSQSFVLSLNSAAQNVPSGMSSGEGIYVAGYDTGFMLLSSYTQDKLMYRRGSNSIGGGNSILSNAWKTIAFTDSNVASASKLQDDTAFTAWGKTFFENGKPKNVSEDIILENASIIGASNRKALQTSGTDLYIGSGYSASGNRTFLYGNVIRMYTGTGSQAMFINSSGNVTIGASDLAGTSAKLYVDGAAKFTANTNNLKLYTRILGSGVQIGRTTASYTGGYNGGLTYGEDDTALGYIAGVFDDKDSGITRFFYGGSATNAPINVVNGNVLIGAINDDGAYKLQVNGSISMGNGGDSTFKMNRGFYNRFIATQNGGFFSWRVNGVATEAMVLSKNGHLLIGTTSDSNFHLDVSGDARVANLIATNGTFSGNITATGEISCGGAGEEGVGGGGASVFQHVFTPSASPSVTILHNLGTEDIVITLYEKDATSGQWSVCLTDIEIVSANEVTITFGSTSSQEHKVVIMGGVI